MTTAEARKRRETTTIRLLVAVFVLVVVAVIGQFFINQHTSDVQDSLRDTQAAQAKSQAVARANQLHACQLGNKRLRRTINQRIVSPIRQILSSDPRSRRLARIFRTVPYANCQNLYPLMGLPHPPYFRRAPLPPLLRAHHQGGGGAASQPSQTGSQLPSHPRTVAHHSVLRLALSVQAP